LLEEDLVPIAG
jgi:hypothetical protein